MPGLGEALLDRLRRLHNLRRRLGGDPDLEAVIADIEAELGRPFRSDVRRGFSASATRLSGAGSVRAEFRWSRIGRVASRSPDGWERRLVAVAIPPRPRSARRPVAYCLEPHDLVLAKCVAGRERDWEFAAGALAAGIVDRPELLSRIDDLPVGEAARSAIRACLSLDS